MDTIGKPYAQRSAKRYPLTYVFENLDLSFVWNIVKQKYSPRANCRFHNPESMMKALLLKEIRQIPSRRKLAEYLRSAEGKYWISTLGFKRAPCHDAFSEFIKRVGEDAFQMVFDMLIQKIKSMVIDLGKVIAVDSTSVKAYAHFHKGKKSSDCDAMPGYSSTTGWVYGYKAHIACDAKCELPLAFTVTPANVYDSTEYVNVLENVARNDIKFKVTLADAGYDSKENYWITIAKYDAIPIIAFNKPNLRKEKAERIVESVIPIKRNSVDWKRYYNMRSSIERINSRLKEELSLKALKVRGLSKVKVHISISLIALLSISYVSLRTKNSDLMTSISSFRY
jgi:transposase